MKNSRNKMKIYYGKQDNIDFDYLPFVQIKDNLKIIEIQVNGPTQQEKLNVTQLTFTDKTSLQEKILNKSINTGKNSQLLTEMYCCDFFLNLYK